MVGFSPDMIEDGLWVGAALNTPEDFAFLANLGITDILTLQTVEESKTYGLRPEVEFSLALRNRINLHRIEIEDFSFRDLVNALPKAVELLEKIRKQGKSVYVHCAAGLERSPTVIAGYLVKTKGLSPEEACKYVRNRHPSNPSVEAIKKGLEVNDKS